MTDIPMNITSNWPEYFLYALSASKPFMAVTCLNFSLCIVAISNRRLISLSSTSKTWRSFWIEKLWILSEGGGAVDGEGNFFSDFITDLIGWDASVGGLGGGRGDIRVVFREVKLDTIFDDTFVGDCEFNDLGEEVWVSKPSCDIIASPPVFISFG